MLGDALTDLALMLRDPYVKARLTAVAQLALLADRDKRAVVLLQESLLDPDKLIRASAAVAISRPGVIDATVNPCLRNLVLVTLQDRIDRDQEDLVRVRAQAAKDLLLELKFYTPGLPAQAACPLPPAPDGDLVPFDPNKAKPSGISKGWKLAGVLGGLALFAGVLFAHEAHTQGRW